PDLVRPAVLIDALGDHADRLSGPAFAHQRRAGDVDLDVPDEPRGLFARGASFVLDHHSDARFGRPQKVHLDVPENRFTGRGGIAHGPVRTFRKRAMSRRYRCVGMVRTLTIATTGPGLVEITERIAEV